MNQRILPSTALLSLALAACSLTGRGDPVNTVEHTGGLTIHGEETPAGEIAFTIRKDGEIVTDFTVTHTKEMHLIVVRRDLEHFQHLHPKRDAEGVWRTSLSVPAGGTYWFYADFADGTAKSRTIRFTKKMPGPGTDGDVQPHLADRTRDRYERDAAEKQVDGHRVQVSTLRYADVAQFFYTILDAEGHDLIPEDYLGAKGHSVLISSKGDFVHTHPEEHPEDGAAQDRPVFLVSYPPDDFYRIFTQFQVRGKVLTVDFDWSEPSPPPSTEPGAEEEEPGEGGEHKDEGHGG